MTTTKEAEPAPKYVEHDWHKYDSTGLHKSCTLCSVRVDRIGRDLWWSRPGERATKDSPVPSCAGLPQRTIPNIPYMPTIPTIPPTEAKR